ncbi:DUF342 domain-containing protein [Paenibacillus crassostreae]|uniref:Polymerase n=1 Tax=Paenibacillus crassostreae TaxID=1763538 RepID=A0A167FMN8_9BACL|nr:FapA family protein [Paenibacillus crassostreae]AOZ94247.1 polymerase [Paenibacillus crassostreae]OAB76717.1 polymerase [Paenibacillus crassostreae]
MTDLITLESYLTVIISDDKTIAFLQFSKQDDNFKCTRDELEKFIQRNNIKYGIELSTLQQFADHPEQFYHTRTPIAYGEKPVHGINASIEILMGDSDEKNPVSMETEQGKVDLKEVRNLNNVRKGQIIAKRTPPEPGINGMTVTNEVIAFKPGKEAHFKLGKNVVVNGEQTAMYAAIDGMITITDNKKVNVFPIYEVNGDVDYSVGNIDFVGNVIIRGNVLTGFRVKSAGDIRVIGGVEGAELDAEGSIDISGGIIGYNKGHVRANQQVKCSFIQEGNVFAGGEVVVSQSIMHSNIRAGKNIICNGTKGLIVGGSIQAGERVIARTVGNSMSTVTNIEVGVVPELRNELADLRNQLKLQIDNVEKTDKALNLLNQLASTGQLSPDKVAMRVKLNSAQKAQIKVQSQIKERILEIEKSLEDTNKARIDIIRTIYGGSKIVIGRYTRFVKDTSERVSFYYSDGDISMVPYI